MKIAFVTTLHVGSSTLAGRVIPLAEHLSKSHDVYVLVLRRMKVRMKVSGTLIQAQFMKVPDTFIEVGDEPFIRSAQGKKRKKGISLIWGLVRIAYSTAWQLWRLNPNVIVIVKPLPHNVTGVWLWKLLTGKKSKIILDVDDFELTANVLTSIWQRAAIHWSERKAVQMASNVITATPFLQDRFKQLAPQKKDIIALIPTGIQKLDGVQPSTQPHILYLGSLSVSSGHRVDMIPDILDQVRSYVPNVHCTIAGTGDDQTYLQKIFSEKNLQNYITWHGNFSFEQLPELLGKIALIIDPIDTSITQRAKSSFRTMLAVTIGMPIVTSSIGIRTDSIPSELHARFFAKPGDVTSYVEKIVYLLTYSLTSEERSRMIAHGRAYQWDMLAPQYQAIIESL